MAANALMYFCAFFNGERGDAADAEKDEAALYARGQDAATSIVQNKAVQEAGAKAAAAAMRDERVQAAAQEHIRNELESANPFMSLGAGDEGAYGSGGSTTAASDGASTGAYGDSFTPGGYA